MLKSSPLLTAVAAAGLISAIGLMSTPCRAAAAEDFEKLYAAAAASAKEAAAMKNQWPATTTALAAAKAAAEAKDFKAASDLAKHAEALAQASLYQSKTEAVAWKDAQIR
jgi:hypothetical protein